MIYFIQSPDDVNEIHEILEALKKNVNDLIEPERTSEEDNEKDSSNTKMTPGQMLFAGFSGLFTKVETELSSFYDAFKKLQPNDSFDNIELNEEQKNLKVIKGCVFATWTRPVEF